MSESERIDAERVYWHSRRGMLELDLVLMPFARTAYPALDATQQADYRSLLECEDADIFAWLVHGAEPEPALVPIVERIRAHGRASPAGSA